MRALLAILAASAASLALADPAPSYDPWMWLLWGREIGTGELSTTEGPAFKPLPVAVCALLAPLGDAAVVAWSLIVRATALGALWLAFVLGRRLGGGSVAAGALAALGVALCGSFALYAATANEVAPMMALLLGAILAFRTGRPGVALACAAGCALLRVEAWPFAALLVTLLWRLGSVDRRALALTSVAIPAAWFVPELLGSGDLMRSGDRARIPNPGQPALAEWPAAASVRAALGMILWPLLAGVAAVAVTAARRRRWDETSALGAAGAAWVALVALMAQSGFSGEPRYALPGAALLAIAGAAGLVGLARAASRPRLAGAAIAAAALAAAVAPARDATTVPERQAHQWRLASHLDDAIAAAGGREAVLACGRPYVGRLRGPLLAYRLRVHKRAVEPDEPPRPPGVVFASRLSAGAPRLPAAGPAFRRAASAGPWTVRSACRATASAAP